MKLNCNIAYDFSGQRVDCDHRERLLLEVTVNRGGVKLMLPVAGRRNRSLSETLD
jgi:hypothetical protein